MMGGVTTTPVPAWIAPSAPGPVHGTVTVPGSKSITNRALVLAALAEGPRTVRGAARSRDTALMAGAVAALGADVTVSDAPGTATVDVAVAPDAGFPHGGRVDCGLAGTVMRFVPPLAALAADPVAFDGDPVARTRPMRGLLDGLRALGVTVDGDALPFTVTGPARGGAATVDAAASSQFVSGLLLSGARFAEGIALTAAGPVPSLPHLDMTVAMLRAAGVDVAVSPGRWDVDPGPVTPPAVYDVEPDLSGAAVYLAAALLTSGTVTVAGSFGTGLQPLAAVRAALEAFGARVAVEEGGITATGPAALRGADLDLGEISELTPTLAAVAAVAAQAGAASRLRGVGHIRGHETDRLAALAAELAAVGARVRETDDGVVVEPATLRAGERPWHAYADHRMATAGALVGLVVPGVVVDDVAATAKTLPDFARDWSALVAGE